MSIIQTLQTWWQHQSLLEVTGVITGLLCVYLAAKNIIWNWPFAIISVSIYIFIFYEAKLFADVGLQFYFLAMNIYGWYYWSKHPPTEVKVPVIRIKKSEVILSAIGVVVFTFLLGTLLFEHTSASFPFIDSFCTACSLIAQILLARKVLETWLIWVFVDVIYTCVYFSKDLHLTAVMYVFYSIIAAIGYVDWRKEWKGQRILQHE